MHITAKSDSNSILLNVNFDELFANILNYFHWLSAIKVEIDAQINDYLPLLKCRIDEII